MNFLRRKLSEMLVSLRDGESVSSIPSVDLGHLRWSIFINKLINIKESISDPNNRLAVFVQLYINAHLSKLIDTLRLSQKHNFHHLLLSIDKVGHSHINGILFLGHIDVLKVVVFFEELFDFSLR